MAEDEEDFDDDGQSSNDDESAGPTSALRNQKIKKLLIFVIAPVFLLLVALAGVFFSGLADPLLKMAKSEKAPANGKLKVSEGPAFYDLPEIMVNLNVRGPTQHYLKTHISLELSNPLDIFVIDAVAPHINNDLAIYLRELDARDFQGSSGIARIREALLFRVNNILKPVKVDGVLFKDILYQ